MSLEKRLVDALKSKNNIVIEEIFEIIYNSYFKLVYFCVRNYLSKQEDVEEVVNDVFLNFFNHLNSIRIDGSIKYYLTSSAKNISLNYLKKKKKEIISEKIENIGVEYKYCDNDFIDKIKTSLTQEEYELVIDHVLLGITLREIAKGKNENINTTKSKYHRAIAKLKIIFRRRDYE